MNIKFTVAILMLTMTKLVGGTIDGALFKIDSDSVHLDKVLLAPNEIRPKKEPPLVINSISYLCTIGDVYAIFREGNVGRGDPISPEGEVTDTFDLTSESYRFVSVVCRENGIFTVGVHIQQIEYRDSIKNSNAIYISLRSRSSSDLVKSLDLILQKLEIGFDVAKTKTPLYKNGFSESLNNIKKALKAANKEA